ncbi:uncharacterized protein LOC111993671 [Quercus suber]|uniref:uncharacterized protein LOC111993671 n=1 Tax=Quercus suber TaxID=58331 RepID=UPI000CE22D7F|nr:uncharacterized protein LOC111993671 [Quercus suber]
MSIISSLTPDEERTLFLSFEKDLYRKIKAGEWDKAVNLYREKFEWAHERLLIRKLGGTVLHFAVSHGPDKIVEQLVEICEKKEKKEVLKTRDMQGNVPLHLAASTGSLRKCICIAEADPSLGNARNKEGESPLFSAAILGRTEIFLCLRSICNNELHSSYFRKTGGETILHCAIKRNCWGEHFNLFKVTSPIK